MPGWTKFHGWMAFNELDENYGLTQAFTIGYRLTDDQYDPWTARFNAFKNGNRLARRRAAALMQKAVPDLVKGLGLDTSKTVFIPALSSSETIASEKGVLCLLTKCCAKVAQAGFVRDAIKKKAHEKLHNISDAASRTNILDDAEFRSRKIPADNVLILDDLITRGATMSHIAAAMLERNRRLNIYGVALGKTERRSFWKDRCDVVISNDHVPKRWERIWENAG